MEHGYLHYLTTHLKAEEFRVCYSSATLTIKAMGIWRRRQSFVGIEFCGQQDELYKTYKNAPRDNSNLHVCLFL